MAKKVLLDPAQYDASGLLPLFRGDDWAVTGKIQDQVGGILNDVDSTAVTGATGWFPGASGALAGVFSWLDQAASKFKVTLAGSGSLGAQLSSAGLGMYLTLQEPAGLETVPTLDQPLGIQDPGFQAF